jgi:NAD(P)-dependent dehydrogenase (short-subunit alcohol dehydrogenase family)
MGAAAARRLAADGFQIAILSSSGKGEELAQALGGLGMTGSNQSNDDLQRLVEAAMQRFGRIDVVVNSAGHGPRAPLLEITDEQWRTGFDVYFLNVVRAARLVTPIMVAQRGGTIINISTAWVNEPAPMFPTSAVARGRTCGLHQAFRRPIRRRQCAYEQCSAWLDRLASSDRRAPLRRANATLRHAGRDRRDNRLPRF